MIHAILKASWDTEDIAMEPEVYEAMMGLRSFMFANVYVASKPQAEEQKAAGIIESLYQMYTEHPELLSGGGEEDIHLLTRDYIAGMSDRYAVAKYQELFIPAFWQI